MADLTTTYSLSAPFRFDIESAAFKANPYPTFAAMRAAGPVIPMKFPIIGRTWITTTHASTSAMVKDNETFVQEGRHAGKSGVPGMRWWMPGSFRLMANNMLLKDEPDHRRLRKLVDQAFQRRHVRDMRGEIERLADKLLDGFEGRDEIDLVSGFSRAPAARSDLRASGVARSGPSDLLDVDEDRGLAPRHVRPVPHDAVDEQGHRLCARTDRRVPAKPS